MTGNEIRQKFLDFFKQRGHLVRPSAPLSGDDPTLLFTIAGMVPLKTFFLGEKKSPASRLTSCQLCFRTNDIDRVGQTSYHHTLFEMLGNFSLGDYFKEDACRWGWEFVTKELGLSEKRIWITIFKEDDETYQIWRKIGIPASRILKKGEEDNFWSLAQVGLCGPDTEIFFDRGKEWGCSKKECLPGCNNCSRWVEIWNLVFMQFNRDKEGNLSPLPSKNIDTGMGLERTASVLQGVESDYDTDLFSPILDWLKGSLPENREEGRGLKVISDHLRALTFLLGEGILPSNVGKGYVVRRVLRRAYRFGRRLGLEDTFLYKGVPVVIKMMQEPYPHLKERKEEIISVIKAEEKNFQATLSRGMGILERVISDLKRKNKRLIPSADVFRLYDTYGFPIELTQEIAVEEGLAINKEEYDKLLGEQRERGRKFKIGAVLAKGKTKELGAGAVLAKGEAKEFKAEAVLAKEEKSGIGKKRPVLESRVEKEILEQLKLKYNLDAAKIFQGYKRLKLDATLIGIFKQGIEVEKIAEGEEGELILASTPFYPEGGGQLGDKGKIFTSGSCAEVLDTQRMPGGLILHRVKMLKGELKKEERVVAEVDEKRRKAVARAHTATHLLQATLREILGKIVKQSGSLVEEDRLRFDFTWFSPLTKKQLREITSLFNEKIRENLGVAVEEMSLDEAQRKGAIALFESKYKEKVRVVSIGEFSREVCGGTHLSSSAEIGVMQIISESGVAAGIRRVEALLGEKALSWLEKKEELLQKIAATLETGEDAILSLIKEKNEKLQAQAEELKRWQKRSVKSEMERLIRKASQIRNIKVIREKWDGLSGEVLRETAERLAAKLKEGVVVLASAAGNKAFLVVASTQKNFPANKIIKEVCQIAGGSGGGRWDFAQGGTSSPEKIDEALKEVPLIVERLQDKR